MHNMYIFDSMFSVIGCVREEEKETMHGLVCTCVLFAF